MLTVKKGDYHEFVSSNAQRDSYEVAGTVMYDKDPFSDHAEVAFDGKRWLVEKITVEPEPKEVGNG